MTLTELAERCEQATGRDRELDAEIACVAPICQADYVVSANPANRPGMVTRHFDGGGHGTFVCESYTASLDAAMTLVDDRHWTAWQLRSRGGLSRYVAVISRIGDDKEEELVSGHARTAALALCAATLRARATL